MGGWGANEAGEMVDSKKKVVGLTLSCLGWAWAHIMMISKIKISWKKGIKIY